MAATPLNPTAGSRYIPPGIRQYYWVDTIANKNSPTRTELDAGTDLSAEIASVSGFSVSSESVDAPDLASRYTGKVPGMITAEDSSLNIYLSRDATGDARTLLTRDSAGFIVVFPEGDTTGGSHLMDVFPVTVSSASVQPDFDAPGQLVVNFTVTDEPIQNLSVPS